MQGILPLRLVSSASCWTRQRARLRDPCWTAESYTPLGRALMSQVLFAWVRCRLMPSSPLAQHSSAPRPPRATQPQTSSFQTPGFCTSQSTTQTQPCGAGCSAAAAAGGPSLFTARATPRTLRCADAEPDATCWPQQLAAVRNALSVRGVRPTSLAVRCDEEERSHIVTQWAVTQTQILNQLAGAGQGITELSVVFGNSHCDASRLQQAIARACPNIESLHLCCRGHSLAPPYQLPRLQRITIQNRADIMIQPEERIFQHIAPYMRQLTAVQLPRCQPRSWQWLFNPHLPTPLPLTHFHTADALNDQLLRVLVTHAPNLTHLHVRSISVQSDALAGREWGLKELRVGAVNAITQMRLEGFWVLPRPRDGRMVVAGDPDKHDLIVSVTSYEVCGLSARTSVQVTGRVLWSCALALRTILCFGYAVCMLRQDTMHNVQRSVSTNLCRQVCAFMSVARRA